MPLQDLEHRHGPGFDDHGTRVASLATETGRLLGMGESQLNLLWLASLIHDLGKRDMDPAMLQKAGPLTDSEATTVRLHPEIGHQHVLGAVETSVAEAVLCHHERWDGEGYPNSLGGTDIPPMARIIFVADAYDVMTTGRDYRPEMSASEAGEELSRGAGRQFDPTVVDAFASLHRRLL